MTLAPPLLVLKVVRGLDAQEADPLRFWSFGVSRLREAFALFTADPPIRELHLRGPNKGNKTESTVAYVIECAKKRRELDGVRLPQWAGKIEAAHIVLDFKQQLLSVQPAYERLLGRWPKHPRKNGLCWESLSIMPIGGDPNDETDWSVVHFLTQKNDDTGIGARADIVVFDEPPRIHILRELRKAPHAGRAAVRIIAYTPTKPRQWRPLREDTGDTPRRSLVRLDRGRAVCRWSLNEVDDRILSPQTKREMWEDYAGDPLFGEDGGARWHGDFTNVEGSCPFDVPTIYRMIDAWCRPPEMRRISVSIEDPDGKPKYVETVAVEVWIPPNRARTFYQAIDPASGVEGNNPLGLQLGDDSSGDLAVRWNGYTSPHSVGAVAAALSRHYQHERILAEGRIEYENAATDIEMMDSWGVNVLRGYEQNGGTNVCYEKRELRPDVWSKEVGYRVSHETRAIWIGCIQEWIAAFKAGTPYAICRSRAVFDCLLDMELDDQDRPVAGPGVAHGEDFVLLGQRLRRLDRPQAQQPEVYVPGPTPEELQLRNLLGVQPRGRSGARLIRSAGSRPT